MITKKGLSNIIAAVFLILLTLASIVLVMAFLYPFLKETFSKGSECFDYLNYFSFNDETGFNCYELSSGTYKYALSVSASSSDSELDENIVGFELVFSKDGEAKVVKAEDNAPVTSELRMVNSAETSLKIPKTGETFTYVFNSSTSFDSVKIYPTLESERKCEETDSLSVGNMVCQNALPP